MTDTYTKLLAAIEEHSGMDRGQIREAGEHGADTGWPGFTYTSDGADFYAKNTELVNELLQQNADDFGYPNVMAFIATFNRVDMADTADGLACLKAWFALEEVGRQIEREDGEE